MTSHFLYFILVLESFMILVNTQCNNCASGTFCYTQDNSGSAYVIDTSPTTYCANCMSNCANCSSLDTCNLCDSGYLYLTQDNSAGGAYVINTSPTVSCSSCMSNCANCSTIDTCNLCDSGY